VLPKKGKGKEHYVTEMVIPPNIFYNNLQHLKSLNALESGTEICERCGHYHYDLKRTPVRTMYCRIKEGTDFEVEYPDELQPQPVLCPQCTVEWHEYWDDMWANVPNG
jgi:hypothetical protein